MCRPFADPAAAPTGTVAGSFGRHVTGPVFRAFPDLRVLKVPGAPLRDRDLRALPDSLEVLVLHRSRGTDIRCTGPHDRRRVAPPAASGPRLVPARQHRLPR